MDEKEFSCECPVAGYCKTFQRHMTGREFEVCSGPPTTQKASFVKFWLKQAKLDEANTPEIIRGIGDVAAKVIKSVTKKAPCVPCLKRAASLNRIVPINSYPELDTTPISLETSVRHLVYFLFPVAGDHEWIWRRQLEKLASLASIFNGRIFIRTVHGHLKNRTPTIDQDTCRTVVQSYLPNAEVTNYVNDTKLREVVGFVETLNTLQSVNSTDFICVAHAKGLQYSDATSVVHTWTDIMYETVIEDWQRAISCLDRYGVSGSFKRYGQFTTYKNHRWHYSGTFYWLRAASLFRRNWAYTDQRFWGMESYPGSHFRPREGACLFMDNVNDLYKKDEMDKACKLLQEWRENKPLIPDPVEYEEQMKSWGVKPIWSR
jgi:hypothetical protein